MDNLRDEGEIHTQNDAEVVSQIDDTTTYRARAQPSEGEVHSIQSDANVKVVNVVHSWISQAVASQSAEGNIPGGGEVYTQNPVKQEILDDDDVCEDN